MENTSVMASKKSSKADEAKLFSDRIKQINDHMNTIGWKTQSDDLDKAIGHLTPQQIFEAGDMLHKDLTPYLSAFHVSWLFEVCWADPECDWADIPPDNYDRNALLNTVRLWTPQDHI
jgi:hypothetical protein